MIFLKNYGEDNLKDRKKTNIEILTKFERLFNLKPKFLESRNMHYVNTKALNKFFNNYFVYKKAWQPISEKQGDILLKEWNEVFR